MKRLAQTLGRKKTRLRNQHPVLKTNICGQWALSSDGHRAAPEVTSAMELFVPFPNVFCRFLKMYGVKPDIRMLKGISDLH